MQAKKKGASLMVVGFIIAVYELVLLLASPVIGYHVSPFTVISLTYMDTWTGQAISVIERHVKCTIYCRWIAMAIAVFSFLL